MRLGAVSSDGMASFLIGEGKGKRCANKAI